MLATGAGKLLDLEGFTRVIATYDVLPSILLWPAAISMTAAELALAAWLFSGANLRLAAIAATLMHCLFLVWISAALWRGLEIENCGCFGVFFARPLTPTTLIEDGVMVAVCLLLYTLAVLSPNEVTPLRTTLRRPSLRRYTY